MATFQSCAKAWRAFLAVRVWTQRRMPSPLLCAIPAVLERSTFPMRVFARDVEKFLAGERTNVGGSAAEEPYRSICQRCLEEADTATQDRGMVRRLHRTNRNPVCMRATVRQIRQSQGQCSTDH
ncbi:hypothetical protein P153DRAFT_55635 [Dothidotthia symphoricarpi CBS 119687]|uniref:Uncharacterized protein n=1 Tax=Dothidotthia symphoricarpi CBS 119687 TaxID=1392245 RepID=A0A6A6A9D9_9PLEO|nr:uncharacterized protein P153DRAFT_55635 [Dothidotthia symphoricarpi CBS 119687]KAF2127795.1 hypothetical protein P153DRAFT_55635 [Dothidotthia symphoricarpi CBS 119687]